MTIPSAQAIDNYGSTDGPDDFGHRTRRCRICDAWLCRWNGEDICWAHQPGGHGVLIEVAPNEWRRFDIAGQIEADKRRADWAERSTRILAVLSEFPEGLQAAEIARHLEVVESTIGRWLGVMADAGLIERASRFLWRLPEKDEAEEIRELMEAT